jgi:hypothetical protein
MGRKISYIAIFSVLISSILFPVSEVSAANVEFNTPGTYSWTVPSGVTSITVDVWGGGGGGGAGGRSGSAGYGAGGGGGGYSQSTYSVTGGEVFNITVGAGLPGMRANAVPSNCLKMNSGRTSVTGCPYAGTSSLVNTGRGISLQATGGRQGSAGWGSGYYSVPGVGGTGNVTNGETGHRNHGSTFIDADGGDAGGINGGDGGITYSMPNYGDCGGSSSCYRTEAYPASTRSTSPGGGGQGGVELGINCSGHCVDGGNGSNGSVKISFNEPFNFSITNSGNIDTLPGRYVTNTIYLGLIEGAPKLINLSVVSITNSLGANVMNQTNGIKLGTSGTNPFSDTSTTTSGSSLLTLGVYGTTPTGQYAVTVGGINTETGLEKNTQFNINVTPYNAPTNLSAVSSCSGSNANTSLSWTSAVSGVDPVIGYRIYRQLNGVPYTPTDVGSSINSYQFTNVSAGTYIYGISALYVGGESAQVTDTTTASDCSQNSGSCSPSFFNNATRCPGSDTPNSGSQSSTLYQSCPASVGYCQYSCLTGYTLTGGSCIQDVTQTISCSPYRKNGVKLMSNDTVRVGEEVVWVSSGYTIGSTFQWSGSVGRVQSGSNQSDWNIVYDTRGIKNASVTVDPAGPTAPITVDCNITVNVTRTTIEEI